MSTPVADPTPFRMPRASLGLSIALCTWNGAQWLPEFLDSVVAQEQLPDELVVQDDASSDETMAILAAFAERAPFDVRVEQNPVQLGSSANFEVALGRCRGRYIALADQDDIWYPAKLRTLQAELDKDPTVTMVFSDADLADPDGRPIGRSLWQTRLVDRTLRKHAVVSDKMFARQALTTGCTVVLRRRAVEVAIPFPEILASPVAPMRHDRWLSLVAAAVGTVRALPVPLLAFRIHPEQETGVLVGGALYSALGRAAVGVVRADTAEHVQGHLDRAGQLEAAAARADLVGDFENAAQLRAVAEQHRRRALGDPTVRGRLSLVSQGVRTGEYGTGPLGVGSVLADVVRAVLPRPAVHP